MNPRQQFLLILALLTVAGFVLWLARYTTRRQRLRAARKRFYREMYSRFKPV